MWIHWDAGMQPVEDIAKDSSDVLKLAGTIC